MSSVLSVNISRGTESLPGIRVASGIRKIPVDDSVLVIAPGPKGSSGGGLAGDHIGDWRHHGGDDQAVYAYAREDLDWWERELDRSLAHGAFGENLTTSGINISQAIVGEQWLIGGALLLQVSDPRIPCRGFATHLGEKRWVRRFTERAAPGSYLRVLRGGIVRAGNSIVIVERPDHQVTVSMAFRALTTEPELLPQLVDIAGLSQEARDHAAGRVRVTLDAD